MTDSLFRLADKKAVRQNLLIALAHMQEFIAAWDELVQAFLGEDKALIAKKILTFVFYWYNFMPIARGTAVCGYITLLSLFDAAGIPVTTPIPKVTPDLCHTCTYQLKQFCMLQAWSWHMRCSSLCHFHASTTFLDKIDDWTINSDMTRYQENTRQKTGTYTISINQTVYCLVGSAECIGGVH